MTNTSALPHSPSKVSQAVAAAERADLAGEPINPLKTSVPRNCIAQDIIHGLYDGRYHPGQRLTESQLTSYYGTSRGPVREALNRLATAGVIELRRQRGAQVRVLKLTDAIDILVVAAGLIGIAARLAAEQIGRGDHAERITAAMDRIKAFQPSTDDGDYAIARDSFYASIVHVARNAELKRILPSIQIHLIRVQFRAVLRAADQRRHDNYERISLAVLEGRAAAAEAGVALHFDMSIKALRANR